MIRACKCSQQRIQAVCGYSNCDKVILKNPLTKHNLVQNFPISNSWCSQKSIEIPRKSFPKNFNYHSPETKTNIPRPNSYIFSTIPLAPSSKSSRRNSFRTAQQKHETFHKLSKNVFEKHYTFKCLKLIYGLGWSQITF
jgi:hypothetical protein